MTPDETASRREPPSCCEVQAAGAARAVARAANPRVVRCWFRFEGLLLLFLVKENSVWHTPFHELGGAQICFGFGKTSRFLVLQTFTQKRTISTDSFIFMSCAMDDIHIFFVFFSLDLTNLGGVTPKVKLTKNTVSR